MMICGRKFRPQTHGHSQMPLNIKEMASELIRRVVSFSSHLFGIMVKQGTLGAICQELF